jgi:uncharacterized membrane protein
MSEVSPPSSSNAPTRRQLYAILITGHIMLTATTLYFLYRAHIQPEPYSHVWKLVIAHLFGGRLANIGAGIQWQFDKWFLLFQCTAQDIIILFLVLPFLVWGYNSANKLPYIGNQIQKINATASAHKHKLEPYGALGLLIFVAIPIWSTGPLVGSMAGVLLNMRLWVILTSVTLGDIVATTVWIYFWDKLNDASTQLALWTLFLIFAGVIAGFVYGQIRKRMSRS